MSSLEWLFTKGIHIFRFFFGMLLVFVAFIAMCFWQHGMSSGNGEMAKWGLATMTMTGGMGIMIMASIYKKK